ncbi:MAG: twin-arginine translocase subunit TatC, partial [Ardenticatenia bacterium]|nr:twin-arginine translocase subunit TatC [Ardenticatenia bacterium]
MTLVEHLIELRNRLIKASIALLITTALSFAFATYLVDIITVPIGGRPALQARYVSRDLGGFLRVSPIRRG